MSLEESFETKKRTAECNMKSLCERHANKVDDHKRRQCEKQLRELSAHTTNVFLSHESDRNGKIVFPRRSANDFFSSFQSEFCFRFKQFGKQPRGKKKKKEKNRRRKISSVTKYNFPFRNTFNISLNDNIRNDRGKIRFNRTQHVHL